MAPHFPPDDARRLQHVLEVAGPGARDSLVLAEAAAHEGLLGRASLSSPRSSKKGRA